MRARGWGWALVSPWSGGGAPPQPDRLRSYDLADRLDRNGDLPNRTKQRKFRDNLCFLLQTVKVGDGRYQASKRTVRREMKLVALLAGKIHVAPRAVLVGQMIALVGVFPVAFLVGPVHQLAN